MDKIGLYAVPVVISVIAAWGALKGTDIFEAFKEGARDGITSLVSIAPSVIGLVIGVNMLTASGFFDMLCGWLSPVTQSLGVPPEVLPMALMRPVSGSGSFALLNSIFEKCGADSEAGRIASVMAGSTETTFYAIAVYFGAAGIKKTSYAIPAAVLADMTGMLMAVITVKLM